MKEKKQQLVQTVWSQANMSQRRQECTSGVETGAWARHTHPNAPARTHGFWSLVKYFTSKKNQILLFGFRQNGAATSKATTR